MIAILATVVKLAGGLLILVAIREYVTRTR